MIHDLKPGVSPVVIVAALSALSGALMGAFIVLWWVS